MNIRSIYITSRQKFITNGTVKALANEDTLLRTQMFPRVLPAWATIVADTKNVSDFVQKHFVSATNVSQFAQPKKHHEQLCVLVCQGLNMYYYVEGMYSFFPLYPTNSGQRMTTLTIIEVSSTVELGAECPSSIRGCLILGYLPFTKTIRLEISSINIKQLNATLLERESL